MSIVAYSPLWQGPGLAPKGAGLEICPLDFDANHSLLSKAKLYVGIVWHFKHSVIFWTDAIMETF